MLPKALHDHHAPLVMRQLEPVTPRTASATATSATRRRASSLTVVRWRQEVTDLFIVDFEHADAGLPAEYGGPFSQGRHQLLDRAVSHPSGLSAAALVSQQRHGFAAASRSVREQGDVESVDHTLDELPGLLKHLLLRAFRPKHLIELEVAGALARGIDDGEHPHRPQVDRGTRLGFGSRDERTDPAMDFQGAPQRQQLGVGHAEPGQRSAILAHHHSKARGQLLR
mmetsp:Transcript_34255/g.90492  ORF Transcript_34255/g.90492 Transcript_34255/m.90492 type:complete len:226 (-) Transcript_34255:747-1424(-)